MKYFWWLPALGIYLSGCMASNALQYESTAETNIYHLALVRKGMSQKQVLRIMHKPYSYDSFVFDDDIYDIWFYVTKPTGLAQTRMVAQNLTPLTFKNGVLVGTGYNWYYFAMREELKEEALKHPPEPKAPSIKEQDREFEKTFTKPKTSSTEDKPLEKTLKEATLEKTLEDATHEEKGQPNQKLPSNVKIISQAGLSKASKQTPKQKSTSFLKPYNPKSILGTSQQDLSKLKKGMSRRQVRQLLGSPQSREAYELNGNAYEVWLYQIKSRWRKTSDHPVIFKNDNFFSSKQKDYKVIQETGQKIDPYSYGRQEERMQQDESDQNFNFW